MKTVDVAVIGAGPAGSALAPSVKAQLADLGLWSAVQALRPVDSYGVRCSWETPTPRIEAHLSGGSGSGWHVERLEFDVFLAREAVNRGARLLTATQVSQVDRHRDRWRLGRPGSQHLVVEACEDGWCSSAPTTRAELVTTFMSDSDLLGQEAENPARFMKKMLQAPLTLNRLVGARSQWGCECA